MAQLPTISVSDLVVGEGQGYAEFVVSLSAPSALAVSAYYNSDNGSAGGPGYGSDFYFTGIQVLSFAPGETLKTVRVALYDDSTAENTESFYLNLTSATNGLLGKSQATATIIDNDRTAGTSVITISDALVDEKAGRAVFTLTLDRPSTAAVSVNVATADGSAVAGSDYQTLSAQQVTFAPGEMVKTVVVNLIDEVTVEPDEYFALVVSSPVGGTLPDTHAVATIGSSDAAAVATPVISVADVVVGEGQGYVEFVVSLSAPSALAVSVYYSSDNGSAGGPGYGSDFYFTGIQLFSFAPGETLKTVRVALYDDSTAENTESFYLNLTSATNGLLGKSQGTATIIDNDAVAGTPVIAISDALVDEKAGRAVFTLTLDRPSTTVVSVNVASADGSAVAGSDYQALTVQRVAFAPGEMVKTVVVNLIDDSTTEPGEYFSLVLSGPVGGTLPDTQAVATIGSSDAAAVATPVISVADVVVGEGQGYAEFVVSLSAPSALAVSAYYNSDNGSAGGPGYGSDFYFTGIQVLSFAPGETLKTVRVALYDDSTAENTESFYLNLTSATNGLIGKSQATGTIIDNDGLPSLSIGSVLVSEKATVANFVVSLDKASTTAVSVTVVTVNGTAIVGQDYQALAPLTLTFAPGETTKTVSIPILPNTSNEPDETFFVDAISQPANAILANTRGTATILGAGPGTTPALKSTADLLSNGDLLLALAQFSKAAYALREDEPLTELGFINTYRNDPSPGADGTKDGLRNTGWLFLGPKELGADLALSTTTFDGSFHSGLADGIYTNDNAAVLLARSADALVISFRGTNDARFSSVQGEWAILSDSLQVPFRATPDQKDWNEPETYFKKVNAIFQPLHDYLLSHTEIKNVYVTGHSLGASAAQILMSHRGELSPNPNTNWQATLFAAPGSKTFSSDGAGISNAWVEGDSILGSPLRILGDMNKFEPTITWKLGSLSQNKPFDLSGLGDDTGNTVGDELHSMSLYLHVVERLDSASGEKLDSFLMLGGTGTNYQRVLLNVDARITKENGDPKLDKDEWHWYDFVDPTGSTVSTVSAAGRTDGPFVLVGGKGSDRLTGSAGNDLLLPGSGSDFLDGGLGTDTVTYSDPRSSYTITKTSTGFTVTHANGTVIDTDTLQNVERLKFSNGGIALDVGVTQSAGAAQLLLGAVLGKDLLATKKPLIGTAIDLFDQGYNLQQLSGALMRLDIWGLLANGGQPGSTNTQIANYLLKTVLKAAPDAATLNASVLALDTETGAAQGNFLWHLAESAANQIQVGLVGLATTGLEFGGR